MKIIALSTVLVVALFKCGGSSSSTINLKGNAILNKGNCELVNNANAGADITIEGYNVSDFITVCKTLGYI